MNWYGMTKTADIGHGQTLEGERLQSELRRLTSEVGGLRRRALANELEDVLPRWRGEVRRAILMLPDVEKLARMSMFEMEKLSGRVDEIRRTMERYGAARMREILGK